MAPPKAATVEEILLVARAAFDDERTRGQGLEGRSSTLAGFTGAILALLTQGPNFPRLRPGTVGEALMPWLFLASAVSLVLAALLYLSVLRPRERLVLDVSATQALLTSTAMSEDRIVVQGRMATTLGRMLQDERTVNDRAARLMELASWTLAVGLICVGAQAVVLGLNAL